MVADGGGMQGAGAVSPSAARLVRRSGVFVAVAGPSGAGKDSLINAARRHFGSNPDLVFVRRCITRDPDLHEDHEPITPLAFRLRRGEGGFALAWDANGLSYGLPAAIHGDLDRGAVVVANVSRDVIPELRAIFPRSLVVHVTASAEVLGRRLAARGREAALEQHQRLARSLLREQSVEADVRIENNGSLDESCRQFVDLLRHLVTPLDDRSG